jgi:hypothetical protein
MKLRVIAGGDGEQDQFDLPLLKYVGPKAEVPPKALFPEVPLCCYPRLRTMRPWSHIVFDSDDGASQLLDPKTVVTSLN